MGGLHPRPEGRGFTPGQDKLSVCTGTKIANLKNGEVICQQVHSAKANIDKIYLFSVSDQDFNSIELSPESALHQLYPYFMDTVKSDVLLTQNMIYGGVVSDGSKQVLMKSLKDWLNTHKVEVLLGSVTDILTYIKGNS